MIGGLVPKTNIRLSARTRNDGLEREEASELAERGREAFLD